jgi:hypothetical protein
VPAGKVGANRDVVADAKRGTDKIYDAAVQKAGNPVRATSKAASGAKSGGGGGFAWKWPKWHGWKAETEGLLDVLGEISGFNDGKRCITQGDAESCVWSVVSVASLFAGPYGVGAVRGAKAVRLGGKYGDELVDAACTLVGSNSFAGDTAVRMGDGSTREIEDVRIGDRVAAADPTTGRAGSFAVTDVITGAGVKRMTEVTVSADGRTSTLTTTDGHPLWADGQWVEAGDLVAGQELYEGTVVGVRSWTEQRTVYNLTVDTVHTFQVVTGDADVLVHNAGKCGKALAKVGAGLGKVRSGLGKAAELGKVGLGKARTGISSAARKGREVAGHLGHLFKKNFYRNPIDYVATQGGKPYWACLVNGAIAGFTLWTSLNPQPKTTIGAAAIACVGTTIKDAWKPGYGDWRK